MKFIQLLQEIFVFISGFLIKLANRYIIVPSYFIHDSLLFNHLLSHFEQQGHLIILAVHQKVDV
jgi:hypothetical protein